METPPALRDVAGEREAITMTRREYDDETVLAVDFGPVAGELAVDVVGDTAIVVLDGRQFEFDVPADARAVEVNEGVLTIRGPAP